MPSLSAKRNNPTYTTANPRMNESTIFSEEEDRWWLLRFVCTYLVGMLNGACVVWLYFSYAWDPLEAFLWEPGICVSRGNFTRRVHCLA